MLCIRKEFEMFKQIGTSVALFSGIIFISGLVAAPFLDAFTIDIAALILFFLGLNVRNGRRGAAKWSLVFSIFYAAVAVAFVITSLIRPELIKVGKYTCNTTHLPWVLTVAVIVLIWNVTNGLMLTRSLRSKGQEKNLQVEVMQ